MPRLPTAEDSLQRTAPRPTRGIATYDATAGARALQQVGQQLQASGQQIQRFADRTAELHARDAAIELKRRRNLLTLGPDGYAQLKNGAATEPGVIENYQTRLRSEIEDIQSNLGSMARVKFSELAKQQDVAFQSDLMRHVLEEDLNHRGEVYKAQIGIAAETMAMNLDNPEAQARERANIDRTIADYIEKNGIRNPDLIERMSQDARGTAHQQVIQAYINEDRAREGEEYFNQYRQEFNPDQAQQVEKMLEPALENETGRSVADELYQMHLAGESQAAITQRKLELTEGKSLNTVRIVDKFYTDQLNALEADRDRTAGEILLDVFNGVQGSGLSDKRLWEIDAKDPMHGLAVREKIQEIRKRQAAAASGEDTPTMEAMALYSKLAEKIRAGDATPEEIANYSDSLPRTEIKELLKLQASTEKAAIKYNISPALINAGIPKSADNKERVNAYKGFVEQKLRQWQARNPGKTPSLADEKAIIKSATEEHIKVNSWWFRKTEAYRTEGTQTYPKRFDRLLPEYSEEDKADAYSFIEGVRQELGPGDRQYTDAELLLLWKRQQPGSK